MKYNKYGNKKVEIFGIKFDSKGEAERYLELREKEKKGQIQNLELQKRIELLPVQREPDTIGPRGGVKKGKLLYNKIDYIADFVYEENGELIVEDYKGFATDVYKMKKKLFYYRYKHHIIETKDKQKEEKESQKQKDKKDIETAIQKRLSQLSTTKVVGL